MKIVVFGYSGSGKSTLAQFLARQYQVPALHLDAVYWGPGWQPREESVRLGEVQAFLDGNDGWVIDGNYNGLFFERRLEEADQIIYMNFNRISCFIRAFKRYLDNRGKARTSMAEGCEEKFDLEFAKWILHDGRTKSQKAKYHAAGEKYPEKFVVIRNQRELDGFMEHVTQNIH